MGTLREQLEKRGNEVEDNFRHLMPKQIILIVLGRGGGWPGEGVRGGEDLKFEIFLSLMINIKYSPNGTVFDEKGL